MVEDLKSEKVEKPKRVMTEKQLLHLENMRKKAAEKRLTKKETKEPELNENKIENNESAPKENINTLEIVKKMEGHGHNGSVDPELLKKLNEKIDLVVDHVKEKQKRKYTKKITTTPEKIYIEKAPVVEFEEPKYRFNFKGRN